MKAVSNESTCIVITGVVCMSHSPLMDRNRSGSSTERCWSDAIQSAAKFADAGEPDLTIVFFPDHFNGFSYNLLPSFCVGVRGKSIGDFGTAPGALNIPEDLAMGCATHCINHGVDTAISFGLNVDHGAVQPLELLSIERDFTKHIPIFVNCAAAPRPTFQRARAMGQAVGKWAALRPERILIIGSGGLSHDPPIPTLASATNDQLKSLLEGNQLSHTERVVRQRHVFREGLKFPSGGGLKPLNPDWDRRLISALLEQNLSVLDDENDDALTEAAGCGAHEVRCWIAALSALSNDQNYKAENLFYAPVNEWITGMGIITASASTN